MDRFKKYLLDTFSIVVIVMFFVMLACAYSTAQAPSVQIQKWALNQSGQLREYSALREQYIHRLAFTTTGSPTSVTIVVNGCIDGYCEWIGEWDSSQTANIIALGYFSKIQATATFSGGTAPTVNMTDVSYEGDGWGINTQFTPAQLGINAQVVAISGTSTYTPIITLNGVRSFAVESKCDQSFHLATKVYAEDGSTILYNGNLVTSATTSVYNKLSVTEQSASIDFGGGTVTTGTALRLPIKAASFAVVNTSGSVSSTCSMRILLQY